MTTTFSMKEIAATKIISNGAAVELAQALNYALADVIYINPKLEGYAYRIKELAMQDIKKNAGETLFNPVRKTKVEMAQRGFSFVVLNTYQGTTLNLQQWVNEAVLTGGATSPSAIESYLKNNYDMPPGVFLKLEQIGLAHTCGITL